MSARWYAVVHSYLTDDASHAEHSRNHQRTYIPPCSCGIWNVHRILHKALPLHAVLLIHTVAATGQAPAAPLTTWQKATEETSVDVVKGRTISYKPRYMTTDTLELYKDGRPSAVACQQDLRAQVAYLERVFHGIRIIVPIQ